MNIVNYGFALAALLSLLTWAVHTFLGGRAIARPLLACELKPIPKYTNYYCWHIVTITLLAMTWGFAYAAFREEGFDVGLLFTLLAISYCLWSLILVAWKKRKLIELPQWILFLGVSAAAVLGILT